MSYLNYNGRKLPIRISYYAIKHFQKETGKDVGAVDDELELMEVLLYHALVAGHKAEGVGMSIEREECEMILDECLDEFVASMADFSQALAEPQPPKLKAQGKAKK